MFRDIVSNNNTTEQEKGTDLHAYLLRMKCSYCCKVSGDWYHLSTCVPVPVFWEESVTKMVMFPLLLLLLSHFSSVVSDSVWSHRRQPTRLPHPWDSPGKNTGVGCHFLLQCTKVKSESEVAQSCLTISNPWTAAFQAPLSMGFSRQEYWSGVPLPSPSHSQGTHVLKRYLYKWLYNREDR